MLAAPAGQRPGGQQLVVDGLPAHLAGPIAPVVEAGQRGVHISQLGFDVRQASKISRDSLFHNSERSDPAGARTGPAEWSRNLGWCHWLAEALDIEPPDGQLISS